MEGGHNEWLLQIRKITGHGSGFSFPSGIMFIVKSHIHIFGFVLMGLGYGLWESICLKYLKKTNNGVGEFKHTHLILFSHRTLCVITGCTGVGRRENVSSVVR